MTAFSLIVATFGRTAELHRFFAALEDNEISDCECIVVDQNLDQRVAPVLAHWAGRLKIKHIRSSLPGLSRARNIGMRAATGEILTFPDDDCWYSPNLLRQVKSFFVENPQYSMLSTGVRDGSGDSSGNRWVRDACELATPNLFRTSVGIALFVRRSAASDTLHFDETLGVGAGTPFASGEDTDYAFRLLAAGLKGRFDRRFTVHHPRRDMLSGSADAHRAYTYGCGMGRVLRKREKHPLLPAFLAFDFLRMASSFLRGRLASASICAAHGRGVFAGYMAPQ